MAERVLAGVEALASLVAFGVSCALAVCRWGPAGSSRSCGRWWRSASPTDLLYWAGRVSMIGRREDLAAYDLAFEDGTGRSAGGK